MLSRVAQGSQQELLAQAPPLTPSLRQPNCLLGKLKAHFLSLTHTYTHTHVKHSHCLKTKTCEAHINLLLNIPIRHNINNRWQVMWITDYLVTVALVNAWVLLCRIYYGLHIIMQMGLMLWLMCDVYVWTFLHKMTFRTMNICLILFLYRDHAHEQLQSV